MRYVVARSFYEGNTLHNEGDAFTHEDKDYLQKCLDDGNVAPAQEGVSEGSAPLDQAPEQTPPEQTLPPVQTEPVTLQQEQPPVAPTPQVQVDPNAPTAEQLQNDFDQTSSTSGQAPGNVQLQ